MVRPYPEDVLRDVRATLENVVEPAVEDSYAREQLGLAISLIEHVQLRIEQEPAMLREDSRDIVETLDRIGLPTGVGQAELAEQDLASLRAVNDRLTRSLQEAVRELESAMSAGDTDASERLQAVRALVRRQLDRQRKMLGRGYRAGT